MDSVLSQNSEDLVKYNIILILAAMFSIGMMIAAPFYLPKAIYLSIYMIVGIPSAIIMVAILACGKDSSKS